MSQQTWCLDMAS